MSNIVAQENKTNNWIQSINDDTEKYDKKAKKEMSSVDTTSFKETKLETFWFKKKKSIYKIKQVYDFGNNLKIEYVYYYKNDLLIKNTIFGLVPKLHKKEKKKEGSCCFINKEVYYFKSKNQGIKKSKKFDLNFISEYELKLKEFQNIHFKMKVFNAEKSEQEYNRISNLINGLRIY
ncbi:MAG: hypothetical protein ABJH82_00480 [Polaribacter sp.]|uniref:hypothetical protein n=1 Tax=Polaribacter sp. TaxID=1920175 RepID=UPI0032654D9C